jgi:hypothetical protein
LWASALPIRSKGYQTAEDRARGSSEPLEGTRRDKDDIDPDIGREIPPAQFLAQAALLGRVIADTESSGWFPACGASTRSDEGKIGRK